MVQKGACPETAITSEAKVAKENKLAKSSDTESNATAHFNSPPSKSAVAAEKALIDAVKAPE